VILKITYTSHYNETLSVDLFSRTSTHAQSSGAEGSATLATSAGQSHVNALCITANMAHSAVNNINDKLKVYETGFHIRWSFIHLYFCV